MNDKDRMKLTARERQKQTHSLSDKKILKCSTQKEFSLKIYIKNMSVVVQYILKNFTMHFNKINQTYFIFYI